MTGQLHERYFDLDDISRARFAVSPMWELVASLRVFGLANHAGVHAPWVRATRDALRGARIDPVRILALVPSTGHIADFLTPSPTARVNTFEDELGRIIRTPSAVVCEDLAKLRPDSPVDRRILREAQTDPESFLERLAHDLTSYWRAAVEPVWSRLHSLAESDIAWRLERIAERGPREALTVLHPRVHIDRGHLVIQGTCTPPNPAAPGSGIVLVPCAFAWPEILLLDTDTRAPTLGYAPRGIATLWQEPVREPEALSELLGRTRAQLLRILDLPATNTQLAGQLRLTPPTTNEHLQILQRAGVVSRRRRGRSVFYARTTLGEALIVGGVVPG